jgi:hypothetical protein
VPIGRARFPSRLARIRRVATSHNFQRCQIDRLALVSFTATIGSSALPVKRIRP